MIPHHSILLAQQPDRRLRWMLGVSLVIHAIVFGICFFKASSDRVYFNPYANSISVDLLAAPGPQGPPGPPGQKTDNQQTVQQPVKLWKGPAKVDADVKAPAPERAHNVITVQKQEENVYTPNAVKKTSNNEGPQKPAAAQSPAGGVQDSFVEPDQLPASGAGGSGNGAGGGGGGGGGSSDLRLAAYYIAINSKVQHEWVLPPYDKRNGKLEAIVVLKIARNGHILGFEFEKKSGDVNLDESVARAIQKADPLPPLPDFFKESVLEVGIRFIPDEKPF